ncbi:MAG: putative metal-binding protein [Paracoccaceae bacterium]|jgi:predicted metal-binding protein
MSTMTTWITICDTCKREGWEAATSGRTDGEALAELVEAALGAQPGATDVRVRRHSCLMGCNQACNVTLQSVGKLSYTLGRFDPEPDAATGIVTYAVLHAASEKGQVPYREWPQAIKGHFVSRHPPLPAAE